MFRFCPVPMLFPFRRHSIKVPFSLRFILSIPFNRPSLSPLHPITSLLPSIPLPSSPIRPASLLPTPYNGLLYTTTTTTTTINLGRGPAGAPLLLGCSQSATDSDLVKVCPSGTCGRRSDPQHDRSAGHVSSGRRRSDRRPVMAEQDQKGAGPVPDRPPTPPPIPATPPDTRTGGGGREAGGMSPPSASPGLA